MKRVILMVALLATYFIASAQFSSGVKLPSVVGDSVKTGALTVTKYISLSAGYSTVSVQPVLTKASGTVLAGIKLYGTVDGTNYVQIGDSIACTNITTNTSIWTLTNTSYAKLKIVYKGYGTMSAYSTTWYLVRKRITE